MNVMVTKSCDNLNVYVKKVVGEKKVYQFVCRVR